RPPYAASGGAESEERDSNARRSGRRYSATNSGNLERGRNQSPRELRNERNDEPLVDRTQTIVRRAARYRRARARERAEGSRTNGDRKKCGRQDTHIDEHVQGWFTDALARIRCRGGGRNHRHTGAVS